MTHSITGAEPQPQTGPLGTLVRKASTHETLVTAWSRLSQSAQQVTVRWPREHGFYTQDGRYSPLLLAESLRQALALLTHQAHEIPLGHRLGWEQLRLHIDPAALDAHGTRAPQPVTLVVTHPGVRRRRMGSVHLSSHVQALRAGVRIAHAHVEYTTHPPRLYDRLRGPYADAAHAFARALPPAPPVAAHQVGRLDDHHVVLSPTPSPLAWYLRADTAHTVLFDHPHDHVPGMVLLEAALQAAQAASPHPVDATAFDTRFLRYVELDRPCLVTAQPGTAEQTGQQPVHVQAFQSGERVFTTTVTTTPRPR
jgi:hypothetical protein